MDNALNYHLTIYYRQPTLLALFDLVVCCYHSITSHLGNCYPLWQINKSGWVDMFVVGGLANYLAYCAHLYFFHNGKVEFHYLTATKLQEFIT
jgi:hypothetical protein